MRLRTFVLILALSLLAVPLPASAQKPGKLYRVGYLGLGSPSTAFTSDPYFEAFRQGLREYGFVEGQNIVIEQRYAEWKYDRLPALAAELVELGVDVIHSIANGALAAIKATKTIPIVFAFITDPVASGVVESLARPGGNATGLSNMGLDLSLKRLELLTKAVLGANRVAVLGHSYSYTKYPRFRSNLEMAIQSLGVQGLFFEVRELHELEGAFAAMRQAGAEALLMLEHIMFWQERRRIVALAAKSRLPAMCEFRPWAQLGCFMSYGVDILDVFRRAGGQVGKILKGANPAELPVEQPMRFELVINNKTVNALGVTLPETTLIRANDLIE